MQDILPIPLPWYLIGPLMGMTVSGLYAITNKHLGISGAYADLIGVVRNRTAIPWQIWFLVGTFLGAAIVAVLGGSPQAGLGYGALGDYLSLPALIGVLFVGAVLIGYGARTAGGCTSGHGITGCATRSPGSLVAIMTFVVTAVAVSLAIHQLTGGAV